jgi:hypothetical protein
MGHIEIFSALEAFRFIEPLQKVLAVGMLSKEQTCKRYIVVCLDLVLKLTPLVQVISPYSLFEVHGMLPKAISPQWLPLTVISFASTFQR